MKVHKRRGSTLRKAEIAVRDYAYARLGEEQAEYILQGSKPARELLPIIGFPGYAANGDFHPVFAGGVGFTSYNDVINALSSSAHGQILNFAKSSVTTVANLPYSMWGNGGLPVAGVFGTALTGRTRDSTATGAVAYTNATGGRQMSLLSLTLSATVALGTMLFYDRLAEYPFDGTVTGAQNFNAGAGVTPPSRDVAGAANGAGVLMFMENDVTGVTSAATAPTETVTYTNQAGTASQSTGAVTLSGAAPTSRVIYNNAGTNFWLPLASGDTGVQKITAHNLSATITTTKATLVLARPLCWVPMFNASSTSERDLVLGTPKLPTIYASTCFAWLLMANATSCPHQGQFLIAEN